MRSDGLDDAGHDSSRDGEQSEANTKGQRVFVRKQPRGTTEAISARVSAKAGDSQARKAPTIVVPRKDAGTPLPKPGVSVRTEGHGEDDCGR